MDGLNRVLGAIVTPLRLLDGRTLRLSPFTLNDLADEESFHAGLRGVDPEVALTFFASSARGLPDAITEAVRNWRAIFRGGERVGFPDVPHELSEALRTPDGLAWRLHRSARKEHPDFTLDAAYRIVGDFYDAARIAELYSALDVATGSRDLRFIRSSGGDGQWRTPWAEQCKTLMKDYGLSFEQIGRMTLYQYCIALGCKVPESGVTT